MLDQRSPTMARSATTTAFLTELLARLPFPVAAIQVDGDSEFRAGFEAAYAAQGIALSELPPRSPKLKGQVERVGRRRGNRRNELWGCDAATSTCRSCNRSYGPGRTRTITIAHPKP